MPAPLAVSSFGFLACSVLAYLRGHVVHSMCMLTTFLVSETYYVFAYKQWMKRIDQTWSHTMCLMTITQSVQERNYVPIICLTFGGISYWILRMSERSVWFHVLCVHVPAFVGSVSIHHST